MEQPSRLSIALLGPPLVEVDGRPIQVDTRKAVAILSYLAALGETATRDELATLLWPEAEPERGRGALRRTLSAARTALGGRWLSADRERVSLDRGDLDLDVELLEQLEGEEHGHGREIACPRCIPAASAAARLHRGDFMSGFFLRNAPEFEDWQLAQAETYRRRLGRVLERLSAAYASAGRYGEAAGAAERRVRLDPLDEGAHRQLMLALAWAGDRGGALRQYRDCVRVLDSELAVAPLDETTLLFEQISAGNEPPPPAGPASIRILPETEQPQAASPPLVGREDALERLVTAVTSGPRLVVVQGETGIGKSRLLAAATETLTRGGHPVVSARAFAGEEELPYVTVRDLLERGLEVGDPAALGPESSAASLLVPALARDLPPPALEGPAAELRLHQGLIEALAALAGPSGVLVVDELHNADPASIRFLEHAVRRIDALQIPVVLAYRSDEPGPHRVIDDLVRESGTLITLPPLDLASVETLVRHTLGRRDPELSRILCERTGGNPLLLTESLLSEDPARATPAGLKGLVAARVDRLGQVPAQILSALAVLGRAWPLPLIERVAGRTSEETASALDLLITAGLVTEDQAGFRFSHPMVAELVYTGLGPARRAHLHSRAADTLRRVRGFGAMAAVATHLAAAGRTDEAAEAHGTAGLEALSVHAHPEAETHLEMALALGHPEPRLIHLALGDAATRQGDYERALAAYRTASGYREGADSQHRMADLFRRWGRLEQAERALETALALAREPGEKSRLLADRADVKRRLGQRGPATDLARQAVELAELAADPSVTARAHTLAGVLAADPDEAEASLQRALLLSRTASAPDLEIGALNSLARTRLAAGDAGAALEAAAAALELSKRTGDRHRTGVLHSNLADILRSLGRDEEARSHLAASAEHLSRVGAAGWEPEVWKLTEW